MWCWATNWRCVCFLSLRWSSRLIFDIIKYTLKLFQDMKMERHNKNLVSASFWIITIIFIHQKHFRKMSSSLILSVSLSLSWPVFDNLTKVWPLFTISHSMHCGNTLWKNYALWKTKINLGSNQRTLTKIFKVC